MDIFFKITAGVLITVVLCLSLSKQGKDISILLTLVACSMVVISAIGYMEPVVAFFTRLHDLGQLNSEITNILFKSVGIGLLGEIASLICTDANQAALGKAVQISASAMILWISIPLMSNLMDLVEKILGAV